MGFFDVQVEVGERKDRVTDALNATKAAVDEGIVAGGGAALLHASKQLDVIREQMDNLDQRVGVDIIRRAVQMPAKTICRNAGHEGAVIVGKLLESDDPNFGYDAAKDKYCDMVTAGTHLQLLLVVHIPTAFPY
jgi:chaperonin GroEL